MCLGLPGKVNTSRLKKNKKKQRQNKHEFVGRKTNLFLNKPLNKYLGMEVIDITF